MRDMLKVIRGWTEPFAVATVVEAWKSSPDGPVRRWRSIRRAGW
ncbi:hypothetical protein [Georgenia sp. Z1491]